MLCSMCYSVHTFSPMLVSCQSDHVFKTVRLSSCFHVSPFWSQAIQVTVLLKTWASKA